MNSEPADTRHSLVASATMAPRRTASKVAGRPAAPTIAAITQSLGDGGRADQSLGPAAASTLLPESARLSVAIGRGIGDHGELGPVRLREGRQVLQLADSRSGLDPKAIRNRRAIRSSVLLPTEPVAPSTVTERGRSAEGAALMAMLLGLPNISHQGQDRCGEQQAIETIEQTAMAGDEPAAVLDAGFPFERRFGEIADLRDHRQADGEKDRRQAARRAPGSAP